ncbi:MAG: 2-isopropylmalate synthase [Alphaproteobacteria bacterium]|nr:2-isopropylmalate synthase [Alphaproteobacteria bacterium]
MMADENDRVLFFDTTLRDGEQCPGATMSVPEKVEVACLLDEMGIDIIEAGFPNASPGDFEAVKAIAGRVRSAIVCGLARANRADIDRVAEALRPARRRRIHTFISVSPLHMRYKLQMEPDAVYQAVVDSVTRARNLCEDVEWGAEDATRSDPEFLFRCAEAAIKAGARTVNIADTVGYIIPEEFAELVRTMREKVPGMEKTCLSVHVHDDLGMATANCIAAIKAGARQVECTINGIGERAGNASLEEVVMALKTRADRLPYAVGVKTELLTRASRLVSGITGFVVPPNKAIVGSNAFAHESGIHQHGVIQHRQTYEIMTAEAVGAVGGQLVMGKHSGRHALRVKLQELGYQVGDNALQDIFERFKSLADNKKDVSDDDIIGIMDGERGTKREVIRLVSLRTDASAAGALTAEVQISLDGAAQVSRAEGRTAFEAIAKAIEAAAGMSVAVAYVRVLTLGEGLNALSRVVMRLTRGKETYVSQGIDADPGVAFARAYLQALNRWLVREGRAEQGRERA